MPVFHFHIKDGYSQPDADGTNLADLGSAQVEAVRLAGSILRDTPGDLWHGEPWLMTVTDSGHTPLFRLSFCAEVLQAA